MGSQQETAHHSGNKQRDEVVRKYAEDKKESRLDSQPIDAGQSKSVKDARGDGWDQGPQ